ncbi:hypothetical protein OVA07_08300 [Novosphingobium sp. SL115]|uniref:hypothetical protein n=1 Tax=Novosphingobium sp. SL115 TaxID=2995150 RepID=UPI00227358A3|nr:hypothetical protein [Novosphingobium sp. SL115]MCY1671015.1 hypothetical protein [Novosphingobium sp. SL115]
MLVEDRNREVSLGALAIHHNTLRVLVSAMLPQLARLSPDPEGWLDELKQVAQLSVDYSAFPQAFHINPEMMKAAVAGAVEEVFAGAQSVLALQQAD